MTVQSSRARRTIAILRDLCGRVGLPAAPFVERLCEGFRRYGSDNHLRPEFDLRAEDDAELLDCVNFAALALSRLEADDADPNHNARLRATAEAYKRAHLKPWEYPGRPLVVYVSGPYSAPTPEQVAANVRLAEDASHEIMRRGHVPLCPHSMTHQWERGGFSWDEFLAVDLALLERCDAICMVGAYEASRGAMMELTRAGELRLWVFRGPEELPWYMEDDAA